MNDDQNLFVGFPNPFLEIIETLIEIADQIRTPETHGSGALRKWLLLKLLLAESRGFAL